MEIGQTYCITITNRDSADKQFAKTCFSPHFVDGIPGPIHSRGCTKTHQALVYRAKMDGLENILVFEDDVVFIKDGMWALEPALKQLPDDWDLFYLGLRLKKTARGYSDNLVRIREGHCTHAICYNKRIYDIFLQCDMMPLDVYIKKYIHPRQKSFCVRPIICSQLDSDIEERFSDYTAKI